MIIEQKKDLVTMITPMPVVGNMLSISWVYNLPENGRIKGFLVVYSKAGISFSDCIERIRELNGDAAKSFIESGGWLGGAPKGNEASLIWAAPIGNSYISVNAQTFRAPCSIEVWTVVEQEGELHLYFQDSPSYMLSLKLQYSVKAKEFVPAEYGFLHKVKKPAVTGVELVLNSSAEKEDYEDGAVFYRLRGDGNGISYPISRKALGKPLRFISTDSFQYKANDFEVGVSPEFTKMYEL